jgi:RNA polymerase sigma-70 factor (ECF subfamily)
MEEAAIVSDETHEHDLLLGLQSGQDKEIFGALQEQLEPGVRRFVRRLIGGGDIEDDIVQDVFIALYRNLDRIDPVEKLRPYLYRIARNRCYDELRRQRRFDPLSLDEESDFGGTSLMDTVTDDTTSTPDETAHWLMLHVEVKQAIDRLPELQRQVLILYSEENLSYGEIAEVMNTSVGTVKSRLHYAKRSLRGLLRPETLRALEAEFE